MVPKTLRQVCGYRGSHDAGNDGWRDPFGVLGCFELGLDLEVRGHVSGAASYDNSDVSGIELSLFESGSGGPETQKGGASHEAGQLFLDSKLGGRELMGIKTEELATAAMLDGRFPFPERCCFACSQIRCNGFQVVTHVGADAGARDYDLASCAFIYGHTVDPTPVTSGCLP